MKIGMRLPCAGSLADVTGIAVRAEQADVDMVWLPDSPLNFREVWTALGAIAVSTRRIGLGPMVTNLVSRHLTVTASAARTVAEAAPGRFTLGLGAGDSAVGFDNMRPAKIATLEAGVRSIRTLLGGGSVAYGDFAAQLRDASQNAPIVVAASGPKSLAMAGRVADGVIVTMGKLEAKLAAIAEGAAEVGRAPPPFYVLSTCAVTDDPARHLATLRIGAARLAQLEGAGIFADAGLQVDGSFLAHRMGAQGDIGHSADMTATAETLKEAIGDDVAWWYMRERTFIGTPDQLAAKFAYLTRLGAAGVYLAQANTAALPSDLLGSMPTLLELARRV